MQYNKGQIKFLRNGEGVVQQEESLKDHTETIKTLHKTAWQIDQENLAKKTVPELINDVALERRLKNQVYEFIIGKDLIDEFMNFLISKDRRG